MSTAKDYSDCMQSIGRSLDTLPLGLQRHLREVWERRGCLGLVRACQCLLRAFPWCRQVDALRCITAWALNLEVMIEEDIRSVSRRAA